MNRLSSYFKFLPRISLFFRYGYSNDKFPQNLNEFKADDSRAYGINFDLPIFNLKDLYFSNLLARIDYKHQKYMYQRTLAETKQALITNILSLNEIKDRLRLAQKSLELAEEAANIAQERYRLGAASIIDLLSSEENLYRARVDYIGAQVDLKIEQTKFLYFLGELEVK
ncbi:MAG: TolC family protein [candidate division WOR-3 bacterium]